MFTIVNDDSGHDYVIPYEKLDDWSSWLYSEDWKDGKEKDYAKRIDGGRLIFSIWSIA